MAYRLTSHVDFSDIEERLQLAKYRPCDPLDQSTFGWVQASPTRAFLAYQESGHILLVSCKEEKIIPPYVIKRETEERVKALEAKEQRKIKKNEKQAIKDDVIAALLPRAFSKYQHTAIWIDTVKDLVFVDTGSAKRAEDSLALLRKTLGSLPVVPLHFNNLVSTTMTEWIANNTTPEWLTLLEEGKLQSFDTDSQAVFKNQDFENEEIHQLISAGKFVTKLAFEWENHLSFTLNENSVLTKIKFADDIREKNDDLLKEDIAQRFDADFLLMTNELSNLIEKLTNEFGGVKERL